MAPKRRPEAKPRTKTSHAREGAISWQTQEFLSQPRPLLWYLIAFFLTLYLFAIFLTLGETLLAFIILLGFLTLLLLNHKRPRRLLFRLNHQGFHFGDRLYPFSKIKAFWLESGPLFSHLYLQTTERLLPLKVIHLPPKVSFKVGLFLRRHLPESKPKSDLTLDRLLHALKL